jgi:hypothetical protein
VICDTTLEASWPRRHKLASRSRRRVTRITALLVTTVKLKCLMPGEKTVHVKSIASQWWESPYGGSRHIVALGDGVGH